MPIKKCVQKLSYMYFFCDFSLSNYKQDWIAAKEQCHAFGREVPVNLVAVDTTRKQYALRHLISSDKRKYTINCSSLSSNKMSWFLLKHQKLFGRLFNKSY